MARLGGVLKTIALATWIAQQGPVAVFKGLLALGVLWVARWVAGWGILFILMAVVGV